MDYYHQWLSMRQGKLSRNNIVEFCFYATDNEPATQDSLREKVVVFDFWNTACGVCFQKFPDYGFTKNIVIITI
ncbi:MAG: hypothetical protein LBH91_06450 [Prevotellaceae bacterium]|nr:hypothetical protein [Prevotellaceae bacterium]